MRQLYALFSSIAVAMASAGSSLLHSAVGFEARPARPSRLRRSRKRTVAGRRKRPNRLHISRRARRRHRRAA